MPSARTTIRGPLLNPQSDGSVKFIADAALKWDELGKLKYVGPASALPADNSEPVVPSRGVILPPLLDCHIHIPQWPIRGKFCDGVEGCPAGGRLLQGLNRNVFPFEAKCAQADHVLATVGAFAADTLAHGVLGGAAYMTVHTSAAAIALQELPSTWSVGLVLMNDHCPTYLRTNESKLDRDVAELAKAFGSRLIVTDRFAVAVNSALRRRGVRLARQHGLRMQTHLNEQPGEKALVERALYPDAASYTDVYRRDRLLECQPILAHCVHMSAAEFDLVKVSAGAAIAHCPVSNTLLGSGIMPLDMVLDRQIPYAICTDVGASPTTSLLAEMAQFLKVHNGRSSRATPSEALYRTTLGAAKILGLDNQLGTLAVGRPASFIEVQFVGDLAKFTDADEIIRAGVLKLSQVEMNRYAQHETVAMLAKGGLETANELKWLENDFLYTANKLDRSVNGVTLKGREIWSQSTA